MKKKEVVEKKASVKEPSPAVPGTEVVQYKSIPKLWNYTRFFYRERERLWEAVTALQQEVEAMKASSSSGGK